MYTRPLETYGPDECCDKCRLREGGHPALIPVILCFQIAQVGNLKRVVAIANCFRS